MDMGGVWSFYICNIRRLRGWSLIEKKGHHDGGEDDVVDDVVDGDGVGDDGVDGGGDDGGKGQCSQSNVSLAEGNPHKEE